MTRKPKQNSTVEKPTETVETPTEPAETLDSLLGTDDSAEQISRVKNILGEVVARRQIRQIFVNIGFRTRDGDVSVQWNDDATFDEVLQVLDVAQRRVVEERYKATVAEEAKKQAPETPAPEHPHEH